MKFKSTVKPVNDRISNHFHPHDLPLVEKSIADTHDNDIAIATFLARDAESSPPWGDITTARRHRSACGIVGLAFESVFFVSISICLSVLSVVLVHAGTALALLGLIWAAGLAVLAGVVGLMSACVVVKSVRADRSDAGYFTALPEGAEIADSALKGDQKIAVGTKGLHYLHHRLRPTAVTFIAHEDIDLLEHRRIGKRDFLVIGSKGRFYPIPATYDDIADFLNLLKTRTALEIDPPLPAGLSEKLGPDLIAHQPIPDKLL
jgi:hypothetical protein